MARGRARPNSWITRKEPPETRGHEPDRDQQVCDRDHEREHEVDEEHADRDVDDRRDRVDHERLGTPAGNQGIALRMISNASSAPFLPRRALSDTGPGVVLIETVCPACTLAIVVLTNAEEVRSEPAISMSASSATFTVRFRFTFLNV